MRVSEAVRCGRQAYAGARPDRRVRVPDAPVIRGGRLQLSVPRGPLHEFAEVDYCYGVGPLTLRVDRIGWDRPVPHDGDTWLEVEGVVISPAGREGARRLVLVRARRLPVRPPRKRPRLRP
ncbi:hypothetical protein [Jidongwangia harbinensis]|uniref:hypothetical protein n=1 Tax=Jidongwangia harbinensis TaxID=2878561 RepID=UPI001CD9797A|nr:hypothetical protein [Jidongwangia harbinensis]MCA2215758.1 hypothetical protein [Jidongwangia harbinensis]